MEDLSKLVDSINESKSKLDKIHNACKEIIIDNDLASFIDNLQPLFDGLTDETFRHYVIVSFWHGLSSAIQIRAQEIVGSESSTI